MTFSHNLNAFLIGFTGSKICQATLSSEEQAFVSRQLFQFSQERQLKTASKHSLHTEILSILNNTALWTLPRRLFTILRKGKDNFLYKDI